MFGSPMSKPLCGGSVNVTVAEIAPGPGGMSIDAVAVELSIVPVSTLLVTVAAAPTAGVTRTEIAVPSGIFEADSAIMAGLVGGVAKVTSGVSQVPVGAVRNAIPPTDVLRNTGSMLGT